MDITYVFSEIYILKINYKLCTNTTLIFLERINTNKRFLTFKCI